MKISRELLTGIILLSISSMVFSADIPASLPSSTKVAAKVDLEKLRTHELFNKMVDKHQDEYQNFWKDITEKTGIDPKCVKTIWIAGVKKDYGMIILEGNFDPAKISETAAGKKENIIVQRENCLFALTCPDKRRAGKINLAVVFNPSTIAIGNPAFVDEFIESYNRGGDTALGNSVKDTFSKNCIFQGKMLSLPEDVNDKKPLLSSINSGELLVDLEKNLTFDLKMCFMDEMRAVAMEQILNGILVFHRNADIEIENENRRMIRENFLDNIGVERNSNTIFLHSKIDGEILDDIVSTYSVNNMDKEGEL